MDARILCDSVSEPNLHRRFFNNSTNSRTCFPLFFYPVSGRQRRSDSGGVSPLRTPVRDLAGDTARASSLVVRRHNNGHVSRRWSAGRGLLSIPIYGKKTKQPFYSKREVYQRDSCQRSAGEISNTNNKSLWEKFYQEERRPIPGRKAPGTAVNTCITCLYSNQNVGKTATLRRFTNSWYTGNCLTQVILDLITEKLKRVHFHPHGPINLPGLGTVYLLYPPLVGPASNSTPP